MSEYEQENASTREDLAQLQGQMGTILEHLQDQRDNADVVNPINATTANTNLVVMDPIDTVVQPATASQPLFTAGPSRFVVAYP